MADKENLDNMAKRYKEEMLRLYRMNGSAHSAGDAPPVIRSESPRPVPAVPQVPENNKPAAAECGNGECRFLTPEEIIAGESRDKAKEQLHAPTDLTGSDITPLLINGVGFASGNLVSSGGTDCDCAPVETAVSAEENNSPTKFKGILIRTLYTSAASSSENPLSSDVYAEEIPSYLRLPPDIPSNDPVPSVLDPMYSVSGRWNSLTGDSSWGYIQFEIGMGEKNDPIQGATVVISRKAGDRTLLSRILSTDSTGLTYTAALPSPAETPSSSAGCTPYAVYSAMIFAKGYYPIYDMKVEIYPGIKTIRPVRLAALPSVSG